MYYGVSVLENVHYNDYNPIRTQLELLYLNTTKKYMHIIQSYSAYRKHICTPLETYLTKLLGKTSTQ